jgi:hypothetical protein
MCVRTADPATARKTDQIIVQVRAGRLGALPRISLED